MNHIAWRSVKDSREVSVGGFHPILTRGNRVGYRNRGVKDSAGFHIVGNIRLGSCVCYPPTDVKEVIQHDFILTLYR